MKDFIKTNKWIINTLIIVLAQISTVAGLPQWLAILIQVLSITLTVLIQRVENENEALEAKQNLMAANLRNTEDKKPFVKVTVHKMLWDLIKQIPTDFKRENLKKEENIPSHLLLGGGMLFLIYPLTLTGLPVWFILSIGSFSAIILGMCIEAVQTWFFDGVNNNRDIRWTWYGYFAFIPFYYMCAAIGEGVLADVIAAASFFIVAFVLHFLNRN